MTAGCSESLTFHSQPHVGRRGWSTAWLALMKCNRCLATELSSLGTQAVCVITVEHMLLTNVALVYADVLVGENRLSN